MTPADKFLLAATPDPETDHRAGNLNRANETLAQYPTLPDDNFLAACVLGDYLKLLDHLANNPHLAITPAGPRGWLPLCYLAFSRYLRLDRARSGDFFAAAIVLLQHGADPNSYWTLPSDPSYKEPVLYGAAGIANDIALTHLLLSRGADPNDHESLYHAAEFENNTALLLLLQHITDKSWLAYCMCHKLDYEHPAGLKLFLHHGADPDFLIDRGQRKGDRPLHFALIRHRSATIIDILLTAGANPNLPDASGLSPHQLALKLGRLDIATLLRTHGAQDDATPRLHLLAALSTANENQARALITQHPHLLNELTPDDHTILIDAAQSGNTRAIALMLSPPFNFPIEIRKPKNSAWDGTPLHHACYHAHPDTVQLLLQHGADPHLLHAYGGNALTTMLHAATHPPHNNPNDLQRHRQTLQHLATHFPAEEITRAAAQLAPPQ